jgi:hypothetical protein
MVVTVTVAAEAVNAEENSRDALRLSKVLEMLFMHISPLGVPGDRESGRFSHPGIGQKGERGRRFVRRAFWVELLRDPRPQPVWVAAANAGYVRS